MASQASDKAVFFDLDGTLADSLGMLRDVYARFMNDFGLTADMDEFEHFNGVLLADVVAILRARYGIAGSIAELSARYLEAVESAYAEVEPFAGARELLESLSADGWQMALVTSNNRVCTQNWLVRHRLAAHFPVLVCAEDVARAKPDPEPYATALKRSGVARERAWVVEDAELGVASAIAAGLRTIYVGSHSLPAQDDVHRVHQLTEVKDVLDGCPV